MQSRESSYATRSLLQKAWILAVLFLLLGSLVRSEVVTVDGPGVGQEPPQNAGPKIGRKPGQCP